MLLPVRLTEEVLESAITAHALPPTRFPVGGKTVVPLSLSIWQAPAVVPAWILRRKRGESLSYQSEWVTWIGGLMRL